MTIFSKIIAGIIPCYRIAENEHFIAFLDIYPHAEGHVLVVPKIETDKFFDLKLITSLLSCSLHNPLPGPSNNLFPAIAVV